MKKWLYLLLTASAGLMLAGCGATHLASEGEPAANTAEAGGDALDFKRLEGQTYTPSDWPEPLEANVYLPETPGEGLRPAALVVHGGGWQSRGPEDMQSIARKLAEQGYVVINIEHRKAPEYKFPEPFYDLQQAMAWLHSKADVWRVDTQRIVGVGFSSGAHLVSLLALAGAEGPLAKPYGGEHTQLAAVVAGGLPSDLFKFADGRLVVEFIGGTRAEEPEAYYLASPARHITPQAPPFFLFHGTWDRLVPVNHATDFYDELKANDVEAELYLQHFRGHITSFLTRGNAVDAGIAFLNQQVF